LLDAWPETVSLMRPIGVGFYMRDTGEQAVLDQVADLQSRGLFLSAYDVAMAAIGAGAASAALRHAAVLCLARGGARGSALRLVDAWGLRNSADPEMAGLFPRLLKDIALESRQRKDAAAAADAYDFLWRRTGSAWLGVNAAAMRLLAGDVAASLDIAGRIAAALNDAGDYWAAATQAELCLLLGDRARSLAWLTLAECRAGRDMACRAVTRRQLRWEAELLGGDGGFIDTLVVPDTVHFCGLIPGGLADEAPLRAAVDRALSGVGYAFGSLAAGGDIVCAEAALALGVEVTVFLPYPAADFVERSVRPAGEAWVARFARCLERAADVRILGQAAQDDLDFGLVSRRAMGLARLHAARLESRVWQLAVWDGAGDAAGLAGTAADMAAWRGAGGATEVFGPPWPPKDRVVARGAPARVAGAVLFADLPKFSALDDAALAAFYAGPMVAMGAVIDAAAPLYRNAWGDAVQAVFGDPVAAARCALALRDALSPAALEEMGFSRAHSPRLALDFGGLHAVFDAVQGVGKFAGRAMTRASRIEPVTPPGSIYATEAFACEIALRPERGVGLDYAGLVPAAKNFGILPLYAVRGVKGRTAHI
jgi:hypothetical protein